MFLNLLIIGLCFSYAQKKVEKIELNGDTYTVTKAFPKEILGKYLYEKKRRSYCRTVREWRRCFSTSYDRSY